MNIQMNNVSNEKLMKIIKLLSRFKLIFKDHNYKLIP